MEDFPNNENTNQGEQNETNKTEQLSEMPSFEEHIKAITPSQSENIGKDEEEDEEMSDEEIESFLDELPEKQREWAEYNKGGIEEYVADGKGYLFLDPRYIGALSAELFETNDYKLEQITEYFNEDSDKVEMWTDKIEELELSEKEVHDLASVNPNLDIWGDEGGSIEYENSLIEAFKQVPATFPGVISFWLKYKPEAFAISNDPEILKKISEHSLEIAKSTMTYEDPYERANTGTEDEPIITTCGTNPNYYVIKPEIYDDYEDEGDDGEAYILKERLDGDGEITPNDIETEVS